MGGREVIEDEKTCSRSVASFDAVYIIRGWFCRKVLPTIGTFQPPHLLPAEITLPYSLTLGLITFHAALHVGDAKVKWLYPLGVQYPDVSR